MSRPILEYICFFEHRLYRELVSVGVIMVYLNATYLYSYPTLSTSPFKRARME